MKTKIHNFFILIVSVFLMAVSCEKKQEASDLETLRNSSNRKSYPVAKMDSAKAIQLITKQKIQELFDLSTLYTSGNRDTEIDTVIYQQMQGYFAKNDSDNVKNLLKELDSLNVKTAKVGTINISKVEKQQDTLGLANFNVEYFGDGNQSLGSRSRTAQYILKQSPVKFKKEFKFYFVDFDYKAVKDSTSSGKTK